MIKLADLIDSPSADGSFPSLGSDPFREDDALQEAQLLGVRFDAVEGVAALLFELRLALQLHETNTGILVARGVRQLSWSGLARGVPRVAWTVGGSTVRAEGPTIRISLGLWPSPGASLELLADAAAFYVGDVPGLDEAPPDYTEDDDETVGAGVANWDSPFVILGAARSDD